MTEQPVHNLKETVLTRIASEGVKPSPKYVFFARNVVFAAVAFLAVIVGSLAIAVSIFTSLHAGWEYYELTHQNRLTFTVSILPYIWISVLLGTLVLGYFNLRHTKRGYRYSASWVFIGLVFASTLGGVVLYNFNLGRVLDEEAAQYLPRYRSSVGLQQDFWHAPELGRIIGVVSVVGSSTIAITDIDGITWNIDTEVLPVPDQKRLETGRDVRLIALIDQDDRTGTGCMALPGVETEPVPYREAMERRRDFKTRIEDDFEEVMEHFSLIEVDKMHACRELIEQLLGRQSLSGKALPVEKEVLLAP